MPETTLLASLLVTVTGWSFCSSLKSVSGGSGHSLTVPIANANYETASDGDTVLWNKSQSQTLFKELQNDQPVTVTNNDASSVVSGN